MTVVPPVPRNGGQILMQQLRIHGARRVFLVPGESYLPCIDALHEHAGAIEPVVCRQESGAAYMAEAYGKLTGEPGICFVTRGPGATNASIGVHTAFQDSTPMILFVGQVGNDFMEREAFQEIDYRRMFGPMAKWVAQIDRCDRIPEFIARAYATATSGRPGPVVLALPEDTLWARPPSRTCRATSACRTIPARRTSNACAPRWTPRAIPSCCWAAAAGPPGRSSASPPSPRPRAAGRHIRRRLECFDQRHPNAAGQVGWGMTDALRAPRGRRPDPGRGHAAGRGHHRRLSAAGLPAAGAAADPRASRPGRTGPRLPALAGRRGRPDRIRRGRRDADPRPCRVPRRPCARPTRNTWTAWSRCPRPAR